MGRVIQFSLAVAAAIAMLTTAASSSPLSLTRLGNPLPQSTRILIGTNLLGPMAAIRFCLDHPRECQDDAGDDTIELSEARWQELNVVNRAVNASIGPVPDSAIDTWTIGAGAGDCDEYAVQKRHDLIARGWPSRAVTLAVVRARGQHHLVAVARTDHGDFVLDNLTDRVLPWSRTGHRFVMMSEPTDPRLWRTIAGSAVPSQVLAREPARASARDTQTAAAAPVRPGDGARSDAVRDVARTGEDAIMPVHPLSQRLRNDLRKPPLARNPIAPSPLQIAGHLPPIY